jgi:hypothetical protein
LDAEKVKAEEALRKEKRSKESDRCFALFCLQLAFCLELEAYTKVNKEL